MVIHICSACQRENLIDPTQPEPTTLCSGCGEPLQATSVERPIPTDAASLPNLSQGAGINNGLPSTAADPLPVLPFLAPPQSPSELGSLGPYRILQVLGQGGMGMVLSAQDTMLNRMVALKVMLPAIAANPTSRERFLREARAAAALHHDHIIAIHQVGEERGMPFIVMPLLEGESLADRLRRERQVPIAEVLRIGWEVADALTAAHAKGLVHRDIKPGNIWLEGKSGRVKILDFGLARLASTDAELTRSGAVVGTPGYMAPEQARGEKADARSDLFSLGCVLYHLATGRQPFQGRDIFSLMTALATETPSPIARTRPDAPQALSKLVVRLLEKQPPNRPESARAAADALQAIQQNPRVPLPATLALAPPRIKVSTRSIFALLVVAGLLVGVPLAYFVFTRPDPEAGPPGRTGPRPTAQGVSDTEILFGMTGPFSGPSRELGRHMELGINTFFDQTNGQGGIGGRKLRLISMDDEYDPEKALARVQELDKDQKVCGFIGNIGTPTAQKTLPYVIDRNLLFFGAFSGSRILRSAPPDRVVFNCRASYAEETAGMVRYLVERRRIKPEEIAVFAQMDGYGDDGFRGVVHGLKKYGRREDQILRVGYSRSKLDINEAVETILKRPEIKAVVMVAVYEPAALFIHKVRDGRKDMLFSNISFVGSNALAEKLLQYGPDYAEGVLVTQVVPLPTSAAAVAIRYREALKKYFPKEHPGFNSLEGYITAAILCEGLKRAGDNLNTETLIASLESIKELDLGLGATITYAPSDHQALKKVWITKMDSSGVFQNVDVDD